MRSSLTPSPTRETHPEESEDPAAQEARHFQEEADLWSEAIGIDPADSQAFLLRGQVLQRAGRFDEALADYERCGAIDADTPSLRDHQAEILNQRAIGHKNAGALERALADYGAAIQLAPRSAVLYRNRAKTCFLIGDLENGFADLEQAYMIDPEKETVCNDLAWHLATVRDARFRDAARAVQLAERSCAATTYQEPGRLDTLAVAYAALGDFDTARHWIDQALALDEDGRSGAREGLEEHRRSIVEQKPIDR